MKKLFICEKCNHSIQRKGKRTFSHVICENCQSEYEISQEAMKIYILFPFISVGLSVFLSIRLITTNDIFIKAIFIFSLSYFVYYGLCMLMIKLKKLTYVRR